MAGRMRAGRHGVWSWGYGIFGGLGHGSYGHSLKPQRISLLGLGSGQSEGSSDVDINHISCGWTTNIAVTTDGHMYEWGWERNIKSLVQCGRRFSGMRAYLERLQGLNLGWMTFNMARSLTPVKLSKMRIVDRFQESTQDANRSRGVESDAAGRNAGAKKASGEIGNSSGSLLSALGESFLGPRDSISLATGDKEDGNEDLLIPLLTVNADTVRIVRVDSGSEFSAALSDDGRLFTWGTGIRGQLGHGEDFYSSTMDIPTEIVLPGIGLHRRIIDFTCGFQYLIAIDDHGEAWGCGKGSTGCLGLIRLEADELDRRRFQLVNINQDNLAFHMSDRKTKKTQKSSSQDRTDFLPQVSTVSAGMNHTLFLTNDGEVWGCGRNNNLELALPDFADRWGPTHIDLRSLLESQGRETLACEEKVVKVSAGNMHSVALTSEGRVVTWGMNRHGQCGVAMDRSRVNANTELYRHLAETAMPTPPTILRVDESTCPELLRGMEDQQPRVKDVYAGFYDTFLVLECGSLIRVGAGINGGSNMDTNQSPEMQYVEASGLKVSQVASSWRHVLVRAESSSG